MRLVGHLYITTKSYHHNTHLRSFQCKILNNIIYLNEKRSVFGLCLTTSSWSFCNPFSENMTHLVWLYNNTMSLEKITIEIERWYNSSSISTKGCYLHSFPEADCQSYLIQSHILLIYCTYTSPKKINF